MIPIGNGKTVGKGEGPIELSVPEQYNARVFLKIGRYRQAKLVRLVQNQGVMSDAGVQFGIFQRDASKFRIETIGDRNCSRESACIAEKPICAFVLADANTERQAAIEVRKQRPVVDHDAFFRSALRNVQRKTSPGVIKCS